MYLYCTFISVVNPYISSCIYLLVIEHCILDLEGKHDMESNAAQTNAYLKFIPSLLPDDKSGLTRK